MAQFALSTIALLLAIGTIGTVALRHVATGEALHDAQTLTLALGRGIVGPSITPAVLRGDRDALRRLDAEMRAHVVQGPIVRLKVWTTDGTVAYSDAGALVGHRFTPSDDLRKAIASGRMHAEVSDLAEPENRLERGRGRLVEVYLPVRTPRGQTVVIEAYHRGSAVVAGSHRILRAFLPLVVALLLVLALAQLPLAWFLARRIRAEEHEREELGRRADAALDAERRRIAAELHDGVVQDLAGVAYDLQAVSARPPSEATGVAARAAMRRGAEVCRTSIGALRSLLVDLYPSELRARTLDGALEQLAGPLRARGITVTVDVAAGATLDRACAELLHRAAQEALRNVDRHAAARRVDVSLQVDGGEARLVVADDGRGMTTDALHAGHDDGHMGLALLADSVSARGGAMWIESEPDSGTRVQVTLPAGAQ